MCSLNPRFLSDGRVYYNHALCTCIDARSGCTKAAVCYITQIVDCVSSREIGNRREEHVE